MMAIDTEIIAFLSFVTNSDSLIHLSSPTPAQIFAVSSLLDSGAEVARISLDGSQDPPEALHALGESISRCPTISALALRVAPGQYLLYNPAAIQMLSIGMRSGSVRSVECRQINFDFGEASSFLKSLATCSSVQSLNMYRCYMKKECANWVEALRGMHQLESLALSSLSDGCIHYVSLFNGLERNVWPNLTSLSLEGEALGSEGTAALVGYGATYLRSVRTLKLGNCHLGNAGMSALTNGLLALHPHRIRPLESLDVSCNNLNIIGSNLLAKLVQGNPGLVRLSIAGNGIGDAAGLRFGYALEGSKGSLEELDVSSCFLRTRSVVAILRAAGGGLRRIDLSCNPIGDSGAKRIAEGIKGKDALKELGISNIRISHSGAKYLAMGLEDSRIALRRLDASENSIDPCGATALLSALDASRLEEVNVTKCRIGDPGAVALSRLILRAGLIGIVLAGQNDIGEDGAEAVIRAMLINSAVMQLNLDLNKFGILVIEKATHHHEMRWGNHKGESRMLRRISMVCTGVDFPERERFNKIGMQDYGIYLE